VSNHRGLRFYVLGFDLNQLKSLLSQGSKNGSQLQALLPIGQFSQPSLNEESSSPILLIKSSGFNEFSQRLKFVIHFSPLS
jgi:hypothetical protein